MKQKLYPILLSACVLLLYCNEPMTTGPVMTWRGEELVHNNNLINLYPQSHPLENKVIFIATGQSAIDAEPGDKLAGESLREFDQQSKTSKELYHHAQGLAFPDYSRDGKRLIFCKKTQTLDIMLMDIESGKIDILVQSDKDDWYPRWSPDDRQIAFIHDERLAVTSADNPVPLYPQGITGAVSGLCWSLDGSEIIFAAEQNGQSKIYAWHTQTRAQRLLATNYLSGSWPELTQPPGGLAEEMGPQLSFRDGTDIYLFSLKTYKKSCIARDGNMPRWTADRSSILFTRDGNIFRSSVYILLDG
ncbi:hypothetical protein GF407_00030 [candidate division KSB1 bacterium]|nr:hypothetical protein [candidate division KSB1 bacterium]